jgi:hypothetical protein
MPKTKMDYSNTIIYKIFCKDPTIKQLYIGHTTNFVNRKSAHKTSCKNNNSYIYRYIRAHGGWDNWKILILNDINCKNYEEARKAEKSYIDKYNSELNSSNAYSVKEQEKNEEYKVAMKYFCIRCNYKCSNKFNFDKHLATLKHKKTEILTEPNNFLTIPNEKVEKIEKKLFICGCGKLYKHKSTLCAHKKKCNHIEPVCLEIQKPIEETGQVVALLIEQNKILMEQNKQQMERLDKKDELLAEKDKQNKQQVEILTNTIKDMIPKMGNNSNSNNNNTTNQFNINMFLNEECKDAINMSDFIKSIQVSMDQLHYTTNNGLSKGLTKVIMDNMNKLSKYERPLHCSDIKRETIYIKDDDKWEKDTHKDKLKKAINKTSNKNYTALCDWTSENPNFMKQDDKQHFYAKTASTIGKPICEVEDKIITSICKDNFIKE